MRFHPILAAIELQVATDPADEHTDHCIDHLREILMCHGDIAVHTYEWGESTRYPLMKQKTLHECRKWEPIVAWAKQHDPAMLPMPILENPQLG